MGSLNPWLAGFARRWHTNPDLCHTVDPVAYHGGRMAVLAIRCFPETYTGALLAACVTHDLGEAVGGDVPFDAKKDDGLALRHEVIERRALRAMMPMHSQAINQLERSMLKFLDRLDAYLWARHHAPNLMARADWREQRAWLVQKAVDLGADTGIFDL